MKKAGRTALAFALVLCMIVSLFPVMGAAVNTANFDTFLQKLETLEGYADAYKAANPDETSDAFELVLNYVRTAKGEYTSSHWSSLAGEENEAFSAYVAEQDAANGTNVQEIKTYSRTGKDMMYVANGNKVDMLHMFGTMNITYFWSSRYPETAARPYADIGGWAGDLVDLLSKSTDMTGTIDEMTYEAYWNRFANDLGSGSFNIDDVWGDFDAYCFMETHAATGEPLSAIMRGYYTAELSMADRVLFFTEHRFPGASTRDELRSAVKSAYSGNILLTALESNGGLENVDDQREACLNAFADYLYTLVHGPEFDIPAVELTAGQALSDAAVTGTVTNVYGDAVAGSFAWSDGSVTPDKSGMFTAVFTPEDTFHYGVTEVMVPVQVDGQAIDEPTPTPTTAPTPTPTPTPTTEPEIENDYFSTFYSTSSTLAPGVTQKIQRALTRDNKQMVIYSAEIDISRDDVILATNYNNNDPTTIPELAPVSEQMEAAQAKHTNPDDPDNYIENYNVVFGSNADFFTMSDGKPSSAFVMDGVIYTDAKANNNYFFAILKDGTPVIASNRDWPQYRDNSWQAVGGGALLVENGQTKISSSTNYYNSRAPRTCIGITAEGKVVVMAIDGRQEPWSCGASSQEMAAAMISLGCVTAMNLDGGGSTTFISKPEGEDHFRVINRPSDGYERRVSTSLMVASTAENTDVLDHAAILADDTYLMPGAETPVSMIGVNAAGGSAELPADAQLVVRESDMGTIADGVFTAGSQTGDVHIDCVSGDQVLGTIALQIVIPDTLGFENGEVVAIYGASTTVPVLGYYEGNLVKLTADPDYIVMLSFDENVGYCEGFDFIAADESCGVRTTELFVVLTDESAYASIPVHFYRADEAMFDFNNATAGDRKLAWNREVTNSVKTRDENGTLDVYELVEPGVDQEVRYTFALDMNDLAIPDNIAVALPVVASFLGVDASELGAWQLLLALAERVSPATTVTVKVHVDPRLEMDISDMRINCEYFELTDSDFDAETSTLTLTAHWIKVYGPIDPNTANPLCIVSGLKARVKDGADWDENDRLTIANSGEITYTAGIRSSQAYNLAGGALGQQYGLFPYDNTANLENDKGAMFSSTHATFSDKFIIDSTDHEGWVTTEDGTVFYYENNVKVTGLQKVPAQDGSGEELYYQFTDDGICKGKFTGLQQIDGKWYYIINGKPASGWYEIDGDYYCFKSDGSAQTGTKKFGPATYEFEETGKAKSGCWVTTEEGTRYYYAGTSYYMPRGGGATVRFAEIDGQIYGFGPGGYLYRDGYAVVRESNNEFLLYAFDENGVSLGVQDEIVGVVHLLDGNIIYAENAKKTYHGVYVEYYDADGNRVETKEEAATAVYMYFGYNGNAALDCDRVISKDNGLLVKGETYHFDENGQYIVDLTAIKNGIYEEDGGKYYYLNGERYRNGLFEYTDGYMYYASAGGVIQTAKRYTAYVPNTDRTGMEKQFYYFDPDGRLFVPEITFQTAVKDTGVILNPNAKGLTLSYGYGMADPVAPSYLGYELVSWRIEASTGKTKNLEAVDGTLNVDKFNKAVNAVLSLSGYDRETTVTVTALYEKTADTYTVDLSYTMPDGTVVPNYTTEPRLVGDALQISTSETFVDGENTYYFDHWLINGQEYASLDVTLRPSAEGVYAATAVYAEQETAAAPTLVVTDAFAETTNDIAKLGVTLSYAVPEGYEMQSVGFRVSTKDPTLQETFSLSTSKLTTPDGSYTVHINVNSKKDTTVYVCAYLIVTNTATGETETILTDPVGYVWSQL